MLPIEIIFSGTFINLFHTFRSEQVLLSASQNEIQSGGIDCFTIYFGEWQHESNCALRESHFSSAGVKNLKPIHHAIKLLSSS